MREIGRVVLHHFSGSLGCFEKLIYYLKIKYVSLSIILERIVFKSYWIA